MEMTARSAAAAKPARRRLRFRSVAEAQANGFTLRRTCIGVNGAGFRLGDHYWFVGLEGFTSESEPRETRGGALAVLNARLGA